MAATGRLQGETVLVADEKEGNTLYNKGAFGVPQRGGALLLDLSEALYLVEHGRLKVQGEDAGSLLRHAATRHDDFEIRYIVYRDLRGRTFAVRPSPADPSVLHVYPRGGVPGRTPSSHLAQCVSERAPLDPAALARDALEAKRQGKTLLMGVVDEEGDLTYYEAVVETLRGEASELPRATCDAHLLADRVVVTDAKAARALTEEGWFGRDIGPALQLSLPEAVHLVEGGRLHVRAADGAPLDAGALREGARRAEPEFDLRLALYQHLRAAGVVVKTGFKYGTHFRAYLGAPDEEHAPYLIHGIAPGRPLAWPDVAGFVRLAHGVRKRLFLALPREGGAFDLLELTRTRP